jgi:hypothetical protein
VVVVVFIGLAAAVELIELLAIEGRTAEKAAKMAVVIPEHFDPGPAWPAGPARTRPAHEPYWTGVGRDLEAATNFFGPSPAQNAFLVVLHYTIGWRPRPSPGSTRARPEN